MSPLVEVNEAPEGVIVRLVVGGKRQRFAAGDRVELADNAAREPLKLGQVRLVTDEADAAAATEAAQVRPVDDADASAPTGDGQGGDEGEAAGTDAGEPPAPAHPEPAADDDAAASDPTEQGDQPTPTSKDELLAALEAAGVEHDRRWGVKRLAEALDASRNA